MTDGWCWKGGWTCHPMTDLTITLLRYDARDPAARLSFPHCTARVRVREGRRN